MSSLFRTIVRSSRRMDAYATHQAVAAAATGKRVLWAQPAPGVLIIQSDAVPDWKRIPCAVSSTTSPATTMFPAGATVRFGLVGNPIRTVGKRRPDGSLSTNPGRRPLPLDERPSWLHRKLSPTLNIIRLHHQELPPATGRGVTIARHLFQGDATVTDPDALAALITSGVGAGKGFGCGLLLVQDVS